MLEIVTEKNTWFPPGLDEKAIFRIFEDYFDEDNGVKKKRHINNGECLFIFRIWPYIDALYFPIGLEEAEDIYNAYRFTFREGYVWDMEHEIIFDSQIVNNPLCSYSYACLDGIYENYSKAHPDWNLKRYYTKNMRLLDHIYHCLRKNLVKEMLYRAGLDELAAASRSINPVNLLAESPSELYEGIKLDMLRKLNCEEGAKLLAEHRYRSFLKEIQESSPAVFDHNLNDAQCRYVRYLIDEGVLAKEAGKQLEKKWKALALIWNDSQYRIFMNEVKRNREKQQEDKDYPDKDTADRF